MSKAEFINKFPIFCFDISKYDYQIKDTISDVKIDVEFHENPPANTNLIVLLINENLFSYNAFSNLVQREI